LKSIKRIGWLQYGARDGDNGREGLTKPAATAQKATKILHNLALGSPTLLGR